MDLTYITERIISVLCPAGCPEDVYLQSLREIVPMLQSKHGHNYMVRQGKPFKPHSFRWLLGPVTHFVNFRFLDFRLKSSNNLLLEHCQVSSVCFLL